jgi:hypothetical protein
VCSPSALPAADACQVGLANITAVASSSCAHALRFSPLEWLLAPPSQ